MRIAHLSDLHFGKDFDVDIWSSLKARIEEFQPTLLLVTGDFVDDPEPAYLLAAKVDLTDLANRCGASLHVVPGNHDVYRSGLELPLARRSDWFERIFYGSDTTGAATLLRDEVGTDVGLLPTFRERVRRQSTAKRLLRRVGVLDSFTRSIPTGFSRPFVVPLPAQRVLLALFDSNEASGRAGLASGEVSRQDLIQINSLLHGDRGSYLARIALIHHHVLPIAFTHTGKLVGSEQFMVLRNAGTVLSLLAKHHFDLVLHGHHHRPQFARLDLEPDSETGYPLAVAAAGSASLAATDDRTNCMNLVTVDASGRISVESVYYGALGGPGLRTESRDARLYREPMASAKRRAMVRSRDRQFLHIRERVQRWAVTEAGDLIVSDHLRAETSRDAPREIQIAHAVSVPEDGRFVASLWTLNEAAKAQGYRLSEFSADPGPGGNRAPIVGRFAVLVPQSDGSPISYKAEYACANSVNMTRWEAEQRCRPRDGAPRPADWDLEWVGATVSHPTDELVLELELPESLVEVEPVLRCLRHEDFPIQAVGWLGSGLPGRMFTIDAGLTAEEAHTLRHLPADRLWRARIKHPLVGYRYQLYWKTPHLPVNEPVRGAVLHQRDLLLHSARRRRAGLASEEDLAALVVFGTLCDALEILLGWGGANEQRSVEIFAYDKDALSLRPVFNRRSWTDTELGYDVEIPLGRGIAGAAFQQCRTIPWAEADGKSPLVEPVNLVGPPEAWPVRTILAIPVFHPSQNEQLRPHPWSSTCVVSFGSSSDAAKTAGLCRQDPAEEVAEALNQARGLAHAHVWAILAALDGIRHDPQAQP